MCLLEIICAAEYAFASEVVLFLKLGEQAQKEFLRPEMEKQHLLAKKLLTAALKQNE